VKNCLTCATTFTGTGNLCAVCQRDGYRRLFAEVTKPVYTGLWENDDAHRISVRVGACHNNDDRRNACHASPVPQQLEQRRGVASGQGALNREAIKGGIFAALFLLLVVAYGVNNADQLRDEETAARVETGRSMAREVEP
jgi:hypothetical protein